jgi:hypothetical protein
MRFCFAGVFTLGKVLFEAGAETATGLAPTSARTCSLILLSRAFSKDAPLAGPPKRASAKTASAPAIPPATATETRVRVSIST